MHKIFRFIIIEKYLIILTFINGFTCCDYKICYKMIPGIEIKKIDLIYI